MTAWVRRHERGLIMAWFVGATLLVGLLSAWILTGAADRTVDAWNARWPAKLARLERLVAAGHHAEAIPRLEQLVREFPAQSVKHRLDLERERLLALLAQCYQTLGQKRRCLETLERLVAFDPRNYANHLAQARALTAFADSAEAAYAEVLRIHPNHLEAVSELVEHFYAGARWGEVVATYERYLDAFLVAPVVLRFGETRLQLELPIDGQPHVIEAPVVLDAGWRGTLCIESGGYSVRLGALELVEASVVGKAQPCGARRLIPSAEHPWEVTAASETEPGLFVATGPESRACSEVTGPPGAVARVRIELTAWKALSPELWQMVQQSYVNLLRSDVLERVRTRSRIGGCLAAGTLFVD